MVDWKKYLNPKRLRESNRISDPRNEFESDFGRIIFSPAIRRMHDKTQVFPLTTDDNIHSRLTHSMEVMAIGHSLGIRLAENSDFLKLSSLDSNDVLRQIPVILKNSCLVHDIGNPPFGHFGETSIQNFFKTFFSKKNLKEDEWFFLDKKNEKNDKLLKEDFEKFDGNAQGFRVLTKLQVLDDAFGLNLTYGTLSASLKYPNTGEIIKSKLNLKKRGVFQTEKKYLEIISKDCGLVKGNEIIRNPLSFLMEASDSICYLVMDIEDGFNKGWYGFVDIENYLKSVTILDETFKKIKENKKINSEISKVVNLRIYLISILVKETIENFIKNYNEICSGTYHKELIKDGKVKDLEEKLSSFCYNFIFPKREIQLLELTGEAVINGLLSYYTKYIFHENDDYKKRAFSLISKSSIKATILDIKSDEFNSKEDFDNLENKLYEYFDELNNYNKLRIIVDFISGMTDQYALNHYQKLSGQKII